MSKQTKEYILQGAIILFWCLLFIWVQFLPVPGETEEPSIKDMPAEYEAAPPIIEAQAAWIPYDTPQEDEESDQFELLCQIVMAEGGNTEPDLGIRLMADGVLNRVESPLFPDSIEEVVYQKGQFEPVSTGTLYKWVPTERVIQICAQEMEKRTNRQVLYWKTKGYHAGTSPIAAVGHHYYSGR